MTANGHLAGLSAEELRAEVRAVLRDVLPAALAVRDGGGPGPAPVGEVVRVATDADLDRLVRRVAALCADPGRRAALSEGRHDFRLAAGGPSADPAPGRATVTTAAAVVRVDRGAVTERTVRRAKADGARLVLGPRAVLTPLAKDCARSLGVDVEKEH